MRTKFVVRHSMGTVWSCRPRVSRAHNAPTLSAHGLRKAVETVRCTRRVAAVDVETIMRVKDPAMYAFLHI